MKKPYRIEDRFITNSRLNAWGIARS